MTVVHQDDIFGPFLAMQILTMIVWFYMYSQRIPFLTNYVEKHKEDGLTMNNIADPTSRHYFRKILFPAAVVNPSDNLTNLCEIPVAFYGMMGYLYAMQNVDLIYLRAAWIFVAFRYLHSFIHCTFNHISSRFFVYLASTVALWFIVVRATIQFAFANSA